MVAGYTLLKTSKNGLVNVIVLFGKAVLHRNSPYT